MTQQARLLHLKSSTAHRSNPYAPTYAKLCTIIVRSRTGFVFYKHLFSRIRGIFRGSLNELIRSPDEAVAHPILTNSHQRYRTGPFDEMTVKRHRLTALCVFISNLYLEGIVSFDQLKLDYLHLLEGHLPDDVATECLCKALACAGRNLEKDCSSWLNHVMTQLEETVNPPSPSSPPRQPRSLRMSFMIKDIIELRQRNWQPRDLLARVRNMSEESEP